MSSQWSLMQSLSIKSSCDANEEKEREEKNERRFPDFPMLKKRCSTY